MVLAGFKMDCFLGPDLVQFGNLSLHRAFAKLLISKHYFFILLNST